jgi:hypothetical protein
MEQPRTPVQWYALVGGALMLAIGVIALATNGLSFGTVSNAPGDDFIIWRMNGWDTIAYMALGGLGLFAAARIDASRMFAMTAGVILVAAAVWGFIDGNDVASVFAVDTTDNITNAALGGLGLLAAFPPESMQRRAGVGTSERDSRHGGRASHA